MPFIFPPNELCNNNGDLSSIFENFNLVVEKYKHVVESNATARCMIGFTAASFIRNEGDIDIDSLENWLQSIDETDATIDLTRSSVSSLEEIDQNNTQVNRILHVVKNTTSHNNDYYDHQYTDEETEEDDSGTNSDNEEEADDQFEVGNQEEVFVLNRFMSRDPYSSTTTAESYPLTYIYHPRLTFVKQSEGHSMQFLTHRYPSIPY